MKTRPLPIAPGCGGCSRREMLHGIGAAAAGVWLIAAGGCGQSGSSLPTATSASCSGGECIDLSNAANKDLTATGGAMLVDMASDTVMVIRTSDSQVVAVSAICTHAGCSMDYTPASNRIDCPCHGSQFSITGQVLSGPANVPLRVYQVSLANNMITIS